jgi:hypothetical protein
MAHAMNNRGQAMIESLFIGIILILGLVFFLKAFVKVQKKMLVDELIEEALICLVQNKSTCINTFQKQLRDQGFSNIFLQTQKNQKKWILHFRATSSFNEKFDQESELDYETQLQI